MHLMQAVAIAEDNLAIKGLLEQEINALLFRIMLLKLPVISIRG
jgi:hypothetical protein